MSNRQKTRRLLRALGSAQKKLRKKSFQCICPECNEPAILSHSQQKEGQLRAIAQSGLVYSLKKNPFYLLKRTVFGNSTFNLSRMGIGEASQFPGFCSKHDREIFSPIEIEPLKPDCDRQSALLLLRAMSFEYTQKRNAAFTISKLTEDLRHEEDLKLYNFLRSWSQGIILFLFREAPFILKQIFMMITSENYKNLHTSWVRVQRRLPLSVSTCISPWLYEYYKKWSPGRPQPFVALSIIPSDCHTDIICSWLGYSNDDAKWIGEQMESTQGLEKIVNLLGIAETEDLCVNIDFWDSQSEQLKELISFNMQHDSFRGPITRLPLVVRIDS